MTGVVESILYALPVILFGYYAVDRALARYYTGSWLGQPSDVGENDG